MRRLLAYLRPHPVAETLTAAVEGRTGPVAVRCASPAQPYLMAGALEDRRDGPALIVVPSADIARQTATALAQYLPDRPVRALPARVVPYQEGLLPAPHLAGERAAALAVLDGGAHEPGSERPGIVVASLVASLEAVVAADRRPAPVTVTVGGTSELEELVARLAEAGYERVAQVEERGQMAVRGGLLDVFGTTTDQPVRIDLFGDEVETIRTFSTYTQRATGDIGAVTLWPAAELPFGADPRGAADALTPLTALAPILAAVELDEAERVAATTTAELELDAPFYRTLPEAVATAAAAPLRVDATPHGQPVDFPAAPAVATSRGLRQAENELKRLVGQGYRVVVCFGRRGEGERLLYNLRRTEARWLADDDPAPERPGVVFVHQQLRSGFVSSQLKLAVLPEATLLRRRAPDRQRGPATRAQLGAFADLRPGDHVVHTDHGIGRFEGFETKTVAGVTRDYLALAFVDEDKLFVPHEQIGKVSRYLGASGAAPALSKLGGKSWATVKTRARRAAREMAGELLGLYARRQTARGTATAADGEWQERLEDAFGFEETDDQLRAIEEIKGDLESERPMDRLLCGDVGFGKTEVALRAAFKVAASGRQVLVLAPTTILAQQHFGTFAERFRDFPVLVEQISRFRNPAEQRATARGFAEGKVDVLIGTHRVLSRDIVPKDLGLVIVDEEQRFGVAQKDLLRQLRTSVDVLALSATPIPRSLQMSLAGLRDISVIETAPAGRRPIDTFVGEYDEAHIQRALRREAARDGQTFYLHNRVETIDEAAAALRELVPELRISVAHGQMAEGRLEAVMMGFLRGDADVLCCSTIVESGLDVPTANTLVVERADLLGLSQLYQIRGRVGRSRQRAYALLLYPDRAGLTDEAAQRLATLSDYTELGSGFKIALRDLEIRGAGDLLGEEQSGHVAAIGFELYMEMLDQAVREVRAAQEGAAADGSAAATPERPLRIDLPVDAYIPHDYVPYEAAKVDLHRRIALAREPSDVVELAGEMTDRFGEPPAPVRQLLALARARIILEPLGVHTLSVRQGRLAVAGLALGNAQVKALRARDGAYRYERASLTLSLRAPGTPEEREAVLARVTEDIATAARAA